MPPPVAMPSRLRANRNLHPGSIDAPRPKRSTAEVQKEKENKALQTTAEEERRTAAIQKTAEIEDLIRQRYTDQLKNANHPPDISQKKQLRPRAQAQVAIPSNNIPCVPDEDLQPEVNDLSSNSGEEYEDDQNHPSDDSSDNEQMDVESEDDDGSIVAKKSNRVKKRKGDLRNAVSIVLPLPDSSEVLAAPKKRKTSEKAHKIIKKAKIGGLRKDWQIPPTEHEESQYNLTSDRGSSVISDMNASSLLGTENDDEAASIGGFSDDVLGELAERSSMSRNWGYHGGKARGSLAKVIATTSVPAFIAPSMSFAVSQKHLKKDQIRLKHLPDHLKEPFDSVFVPRARQLFAVSTPWAALDSAKLQDIWTGCFPNDEFDAVPQKLLDDRLHTWRNKFASTALTYLTNQVFPELDNNSTTSRAELCTWLLESEDHMRPFYFRKYSDDLHPASASVSQDAVTNPDAAAGPAGPPTAPPMANGKRGASGIFQSGIILAVLGTHFSSISSLTQEVDVEKIDRPTGALVLSIQAVKRALSMWTTGEKVELRRPLNDFSKSNWGDSTMIYEGKTVAVLTTTNLLNVVARLKDKQWSKIIEGAIAASKISTNRMGEKSNIMGSMDSSSAAPVFELIDDDSDLD